MAFYLVHSNHLIFKPYLPPSSPMPQLGGKTMSNQNEDNGSGIITLALVIFVVYVFLAVHGII